MSQTHIDTMAEALRAIELAPTERHSLLATERRRHAIEILAEERSAIGREDLAAEIAERESDANPDDEFTRDVLISLHHIHLPKMAAAGVIDAYPENELIELAEPQERR